MRTTLVCFKKLCGPVELLCYPGSLAPSSYAPFITCFQWPPPSCLRREGQVGSRVVDNVWGISCQRSGGGYRALRSSPPFTSSMGGELQQRPRSSSPARQEVTGKGPWEPAVCSVLILGQQASKTAGVSPVKHSSVCAVRSMFDNKIMPFTSLLRSPSFLAHVCLLAIFSTPLKLKFCRMGSGFAILTAMLHQLKDKPVQQCALVQDNVLKCSPKG